jgi:hypothetical protein
MAASSLLLLPGAIWNTTVALLEPYARAQVECGLYWYGLRNDDAALVSLVGIPSQINRPRSFEVADDDLAGLTRAVPEPLVAVAAVHTHPGADTSHSKHDDRRAVSRKILSLVLPFYGRGARLEHAAVHEYREGGWRRLTPEEAQRRVVLVPALVDARA